MSAPIPRSRPHASLSVVMAEAQKAWEKERQGELPAVFVLAVRGYYRDSMGKVGANDSGMYDDAFFIVTPDHFSPWNGNTDPSRYGWNPNADKYMARLKTGVSWFKRLKHKINSPSGYMAFGQGSQRVTVERIKQDGTIATTETGLFGINLHRGGNNGTSSEGCQTVPIEQWPEFDKTLAKIIGDQLFPYILIEGPIN